MDTRQVVLADVFAADPTGGVPVAVVPDGGDLADDQLRAVARELDAAATAVPTDGPPDRLRAVGPCGPLDHQPQVTVGALGLAAERGWGWVEPGADTPSTARGVRQTAVDEDGRAWVELGDPEPETADVGYDAAAAALGVDRAALADVGADLPPFRVSVGVDALAVAVNFLEHLGTASADPGALTDLTDSADVDALCAFTFDTLAAGTACHARTFVPGSGRRGGQSPAPWGRVAGTEVPVTPAVAGGVVVHLTREGIVENDRPAVEQGHYLDRPGRVAVDAGGARVGGRTVASLDGTVTLPEAADDDIVEL